MKKHFKVTASKNANKKSIKASNSNKKGMKNMRNINASSNDPYTENLADFGMRERLRSLEISSMLGSIVVCLMISMMRE